MIPPRNIARRVTVPVRFIVLTPGRAGSILLLRLLDSHPRVICDNELFGRDPTTAPGTARRFGNSERMLTRASIRAVAARATAWGWSLHPAQLITQGVADPEGWCARFHDRGGRIVTLVRDNPVHQAVSALVASETGIWHRRHEGPIKSVHLDPLQVLGAIHQAERAAQDVQRLIGDRSHLALRYEDALRDPGCHQDTADRVFGFIGLESVAVSADLRRRTVPLREQVANFNELDGMLANTPYKGRMAEEP